MYQSLDLIELAYRDRHLKTEEIKDLTKVIANGLPKIGIGKGKRRNDSKKDIKKKPKSSLTQ